MNTKPTRILPFCLLALSFALTLFQSCGKGGDDKKTPDPVTPKSKGDLLIGTWHFTAITSAIPYKWNDTVTGTDGFTYQKDCMGKTTMTFQKGTAANSGPFTFYYDCNPRTDNGTWTLDTVINVLTTKMGPSNLESVTETELKMNFSVFGPNNESVKITYTLARN